MTIMTGAEYLERINKLGSEVWIAGEKVTGDISEHPAFKGVMKSQAELYDMQHKKSFIERLTFADDKNNQKVGISYLIPKTRADLEKRRNMIQTWARYTAGLMGRSPDYMNTALAAFASSVHLLRNQPNCFPEHLTKFYEYAISNDLSFTHTFINPQNNRSLMSFADEDTTNARVVKRIEEGLVIKGAKLLATQGGITDEIIVFSAPGIQDQSHAFAFSIPSNTEGVKFVCRKSLIADHSRYNSPLSSRFEEMDTVVIFDNVLVPWDRVFFYDNIKIANEFYKNGNFVPFALHQIVSRQVIKTEFILGVAKLIVDTININEYQHVQSKVSEIIIGLESGKALLLASELQAEKDDRGIMIPNRTPLYVAVNQFQETYPRFIEIVQLLGASGMINLPDEKQFASPIGDVLDHYLQGFEIKGKERVQLFQLAFDLCMSSFGSRQTLYERFFFGDPVRLSQMIYQTYDMEPSISFVKEMLNKKLT
ncbi:putative 4-hydroxyphenylacetate 3-monooxygenase [Halobacillus andaensis]|uniref:4-hydroxyphenylacetate 3-monooxygenase n=1 Tax=Halobacillus andaensis TaxID=1176239 RepID=A0A917B976_HALAA|nr:4-hydroxyphenylacetate 3-monooxygenase, oxygenase component [Halobacillus andaensis]MBP2005519.1 4-hydroxyphenylacetate 3-monooxygenase [Halobacillus andaensis]GGF32136.1 putative 4-hydroxyphenylacetate 3-monooxygenase [Halobacillus andaensis]